MATRTPTKKAAPPAAPVVDNSSLPQPTWTAPVPDIAKNAAAAAAAKPKVQPTTVATKVAPTAPAAAPAKPAAKTTVPKGATLYVVAGKAQELVFQVAAGVYVAYQINDPAQVDLTGVPVQKVTQQRYNQLNAVNAGLAGELGTIAKDWGSYQAWWNYTLDEVFPVNNAARNDPQIQRILAERAARPDMSPTELQNKLAGTKWFDDRTTLALEWNGLSAGEKRLRTNTQAAALADYWQRNVGEPISPTDVNIQRWAEDVASGRRAQGDVLYGDIRPRARQNPESPLSRTERDEVEAKTKRGNDIENKTAEIRELYRRWGVQGDDGVFGRWAKDITEGKRSDADLTTELKGLAKTLYPWKDPELETLSAAQPWMSTYARVMEKDPSGILDATIQKALNEGTPIYKFEQDLKAQPEWLQTKNARDDLTSAFSTAGHLMGFS